MEAAPLARKQVVDIYRWMRVEDVIWFVHSFYANWNESLCRSLLELFRLDSRQKIKHLSKGMLAKVSLLVAISHEPELLILDEPMSGLDLVAREEFLDGVLRTICDHQRTVVFSSHSLSDVQRMADSVAMLYEGKLLLHCPVHLTLGVLAFAVGSWYYARRVEP